MRLYIPCFSPAGAGGRSNRAILADVKWRALTLPPVSPHVRIASFWLFGFALAHRKYSFSKWMRIQQATFNIMTQLGYQRLYTECKIKIYINHRDYRVQTNERLPCCTSFTSHIFGYHFSSQYRCSIKYYIRIGSKRVSSS